MNSNNQEVARFEIKNQPFATQLCTFPMKMVSPLFLHNLEYFVIQMHAFIYSQNGFNMDQVLLLVYQNVAVVL